MEQDDHAGPEATRTKASASRRALLAAAGAAGVGVSLAGCEVYQSGGGPAAASRPAGPAQAGASAGASTGASAGASGDAPGAPAGGAEALAKTSDIPVGGGKIFDAQQVVVTQPKAGTFKAFSTVCSHAGCPVSEIKGDTINCTCHGSKYRIADGSVAGGPAPSALAPQRITVSGDSISLG